jgi:hypothetical protein
MLSPFLMYGAGSDHTGYSAGAPARQGCQARTPRPWCFEEARHLGSMLRLEWHAGHEDREKADWLGDGSGSSGGGSYDARRGGESTWMSVSMFILITPCEIASLILSCDTSRASSGGARRLRAYQKGGREGRRGGDKGGSCMLARACLRIRAFHECRPSLLASRCGVFSQHISVWVGGGIQKDLNLSVSLQRGDTKIRRDEKTLSASLPRSLVALQSARTCEHTPAYTAIGEWCTGVRLGLEGTQRIRESAERLRDSPAKG